MPLTGLWRLEACTTCLVRTRLRARLGCSGCTTVAVHGPCVRARARSVAQRRGCVRASRLSVTVASLHARSRETSGRAGCARGGVDLGRLRAAGSTVGRLGGRTTEKTTEVRRHVGSRGWKVVVGGRKTGDEETLEGSGGGGLVGGSVGLQNYTQGRMMTTMTTDRTSVQTQHLMLRDGGRWRRSRSRVLYAVRKTIVSVPRNRIQATGSGLWAFRER